MKTTLQNLIAALFVAASLQTHAQGTVYDQQSATGPVPITGNANADGLNIQEDQPLAQSFIPSLSAIGFVQFEFWDIPNNGNNGATVYVNLWTGSPDLRSGFNSTLLGSTTPVYMPNGFVNSGLGNAGVTSFYFSTSVTLTAGQTYYLQPVVLSGDDPWDIITIGDTYPNGQVFENGGGFSTDFWFREGVVPEPSTLALIVLSSLLMFSFKRHFKLVVPLLLLFTASVLSIHAADSVVQATADEAGLARVSGATISHDGTFWVMTVNSDGSLNEMPYPFLPSNLSTLPIYSVAGKFIVDDTGGQLSAPSSSSFARMSTAQTMSVAQGQAETMAGLIDLLETNDDNQSFQPNGFFSMIDTNGWWLESLKENPYIGLRMHNTVVGDNYQLLSTSNLENHGWDLGQILNATDNQMDFTPVLFTNPATFFMVHHANPVMEIGSVQYAIEPDPTNSDPGQVGVFYIQNEGSATNDMPVYYSIGGTAQNGVDYSNLTGVVTFFVSQGQAEIDIDPIADGLKPNQTVILTLIQNSNYLIDPANYSATNILYANPQVYPVANGDIQRPCPNSQSTFTLQGRDPNNLPLTFSILTYPTHGSLTYVTNLNYGSEATNVTYTTTNCYEGQDSFTFKVNNGQYDSAPSTVNLAISDPVYASSPTPQVCRGGSVSFSLGYDNCSEGVSCILLSSPLHGTLSGTAANLTYTATGTNFTGYDTFDYILYSACGGDSATGTVTVTVGDANLNATAQTVVTGTNQPVPFTLSATDSDPCNADTNYFTYAVTSLPTNGTLSGAPPNLTYTPGTNYEGFDSIQFTASDGVWSNAATVTLKVTAGPILFQDCNQFGTQVKLAWMLDTNEQAMFPFSSFNDRIQDFIIYRSAHSGGPYTAIGTNADGSVMSYLDADSAVGQTNYYVVTLVAYDYPSYNLVESPFSNQIKASGQNFNPLIAADAIWQVVSNLDNPPLIVTNLQAPFASTYPAQYADILPLPNTLWPVGETWSNHITMVIPSNSVPLAQVTYSIAIDNDYQLYLNNSNVPIESFNHEGDATWSTFKSFESVAPGLLHYGTNDIYVVIEDNGDINYFSMIVSTNACGY